mmetsp:Transcript_148110/g.258408  ORF Transcript_148110/g.258408 Transcript_148110/m.258408 type:complete len:97 (-) Transcript_148110:200-490(-)
MDSGSGRSAVRLLRFDWDVEDLLLSFCGEGGAQDGSLVCGGGAPDDREFREGEPGSGDPGGGAKDGAAEDPGDPGEGNCQAGGDPVGPGDPGGGRS